jgi:integrase
LKVGNRVGKQKMGGRAMTRFKTDYPGVFYREVGRIGDEGPERVYYILFKKNGKVLEEKVGRQYADQMTPAKAARFRINRIEGRAKSRKEIREAEEAARQANDSRWTIQRLWDTYYDDRRECRGKQNDKSLYLNYLKPIVGEKQPHEIIDFDIKRIKKKLEGRKPQTIKHVLSLLLRLVHYGIQKRHSMALSFEIELPKVDNQKIETLSPEQLTNLLTAIDASPDIEAANIMRMALYTGMRRGELFKLKWTDIDFDKGFIHIREPKGGESQIIPLNEQARQVLNNHPKTAANIFVTHTGKPFVDIGRRVNVIKRAAGIGPEFRALHGLRHVYASMLASSGKVDMYVLQRLLTHKSAQMTQRYAHLQDEALRHASNLAGETIEQARTEKPKETETATA